MENAPQVQVVRKRKRGFILGSLSAGHGFSHLYDQGFPVILPAIASAMRLSTFQVASLHGIRHGGSGLVSLGGGPLVDMLKRHWGLILTGCIVWAAISYVSIGASPNFAVLVVAVMFISVPGALWHLPATAAISQRFPDRRGFAISMHGFGSNIGNVVGPLLAGALLAVLLWRYVLFLYAAPAMVLAVFVWWSLKDVGKEDGQEKRKGLGLQFRDSWKAVKNPIVLGLMLSAMLRGIAIDAVANWTPFYLKRELGMGSVEVGFHFALLAGMGIVSAPVLGALSDRFGRKKVLVPGLIIASVLSFLVVSAGDGFLLILVLAGMGLFSFSLHQIILAAALDIVGRGTEATTIGVLFGLSGIIGAGSPFLAALVIDHLGGYGSIYYYAGIVAAIPAVLVMIIPIRTQLRGP